MLDFPTQSDVFFRHLGVVVLRGLLRAHYLPERRTRDDGSFSRLSVPLEKIGDFIGVRSFNADKMNLSNLNPEP